MGRSSRSVYNARKAHTGRMIMDLKPHNMPNNGQILYTDVVIF